MSEDDVTARLMIDYVVHSLKGFRNLLARKQRQLGHKLTSTTSSSIEGGIGSSCFLRLSK